MAARQAHNLEAVGPSPTPAKWENRSDRVGFFIYSLVMGRTRTERRRSRENACFFSEAVYSGSILLCMSRKMTLSRTALPFILILDKALSERSGTSSPTPASISPFQTCFSDIRQPIFQVFAFSADKSAENSFFFSFRLTVQKVHFAFFYACTPNLQIINPKEK